MKLSEYKKTTGILCLFLVVLICGGIDGVYLYYDYPVDGLTARTICQSNHGILPAFNSNKLMDQPHWLDDCNRNDCRKCAIEVNGSRQEKSCEEREKLYCQVDSICISRVKGRLNVSMIINGTVQCEERCCNDTNCIGISYEHSECHLYKAGATEKEILIKEISQEIKIMTVNKHTISETISSCLKDFLNNGTQNMSASTKDTVQPTPAYRPISSIFNIGSSKFFSSSVFSSNNKNHINPTASYVDVSSSGSFSTSVDSIEKVTSTRPLVQPTKSTLDLSSSLAPSFSSDCLCPCQAPATSLSEEESKSKMQKLIAELTIPKKELSSTIRKKTSAPDNRPSATSIGLVGVGIMCVVFGGIIVMDLGVMASHLGILYKNVFGHCRS